MPGTFLKGVVVGVAGLGVLAWLAATVLSDEGKEETDKEE